MQLAYEYGYGYDGSRRWRKDYTANLWTRYPCTAASCAGDLVEQQSDLSGGNWVVSATYLKGVGLVRRNNEFHHFDVLGTAGVITDASGAVLSTNVYDAFGVARYVSGNAQTQWRIRIGDVAVTLEREDLVRSVKGDWRYPAVLLNLSMPYGVRASAEVTGQREVALQVDDDCMDKCHRKYLQDLRKCYSDYRRCMRWLWWFRYICDSQWATCIGWAVRHQDECYMRCLDEDSQALGVVSTRWVRA